MDYEYTTGYLERILIGALPREISLHTKGRVHLEEVPSILLYGCETWSVRVADLGGLAVFDNDSI